VIFEVLTMMPLKTRAFWDIMLHPLVNAVVTVISKEHIGSILGIKKPKKRGVNSLTLKVAI
jgi:2C-methyl-D-erythritol 2,4-cyclodiphosphate synthase